MTSPSPQCQQHRWQLLYRAAVLESDWSCIGDRISQAQIAIAERERELARNVEQYAQVEKEDMADAIYALDALRTAQKLSAA